MNRIISVDMNKKYTKTENSKLFKKRINLKDMFASHRGCQWEFVYDMDERVVYEKALNKFSQLVWDLYTLQ